MGENRPMSYNKISIIAEIGINHNGSIKNAEKLIKECKYYKIESVLLTKFYSMNEIIKQIDFTKPKTISCSYHFSKYELQTLRKTFKRLKIGISINPENFNMKYLKNIKNNNNEIYGDIHVQGSKIKPIKATKDFYVKTTDEYPILFVIV